MNANIQVYDKLPAGFLPQMEVASIYVQVDNRILLLRLADHKHESGAWGVPAGKLEAHEMPVQAAKRELLEETGINIESEAAFQSLGVLYIRKPHVDYVYHLFGIQLHSTPLITLSTEHTSHAWVSRKEAEALPLMNGAEYALDAYYQKINTKRTRTGASVNAYLVLRKGDDVLLSLRENTGYCDGYYSLVAGHVEDGEGATTAMVREAYEEAGILIEPSALKVVHVMHRQSNRFNIDLFFECSDWQGNITNKEIEKCASLSFFRMECLPTNTIEYIRDALQAIVSQKFYSEQGWA